MFSGLTTLSRTVAALFAPPFLFSVPSYQRSYSWTLREAAQLLEDVATAAGIDGGEAEPDYFLGAILLLANEAENPPGSASCLYDIIDGQQRLAILTILACVLREMGDRQGIADALERCAALEFRQDLPERALMLYGASRALREPRGG